MNARFLRRARSVLDIFQYLIFLIFIVEYSVLDKNYLKFDAQSIGTILFLFCKFFGHVFSCFTGLIQLFVCRFGQIID